MYVPVTNIRTAIVSSRATAPTRTVPFDRLPPFRCRIVPRSVNLDNRFIKMVIIIIITNACVSRHFPYGSCT